MVITQWSSNEKFYESLHLKNLRFTFGMENASHKRVPLTFLFSNYSEKYYFTFSWSSTWQINQKFKSSETFKWDLFW